MIASFSLKMVLYLLVVSNIKHIINTWMPSHSGSWWVLACLLLIDDKYYPKIRFYTL